MPADVGTQSIYVKFFDPVDSVVANGIGLGTRKVGIYSGGYLTRISDTSISLSTFDCEIGDGTYQIRCKTGAVVTPIAVTSTNKYVVLRWTYTGVAAADYVDFVATTLVGILSTDVVIGLCNYSGATLTGFDYTLRTTPNVMDLFLKAEPTETASLYLRVRKGRVSYGSANYDIADQLSPLFSAPVANSWIVLLQVNTAGALIVTAGVAAASPTAPDYNGLITLAEVTIATGATTITSTNIKDVRQFSGSGGVTLPLPIARGGTNAITASAARTSLGLDPLKKKQIYFAVADEAYLDTALTGRIYLRHTGTIVYASASVVTAPTGANLIIDVNKNGSSIWTAGQRLEIVAGAYTDTTAVFTTTAVTSGDYLTFDIDQIGSTVPGSKLVVLIEMEITL